MTFRSEYDPWHPITNPTDLKYIGKLIEELGELSSALSRSLVQGLDETEPTTGKLNRDWVTEEVSDVWVNLELLMERFNISKIEDRIEGKRVKLKKWHEGALK